MCKITTDDPFTKVYHYNLNNGKDVTVKIEMEFILKEKVEIYLRCIGMTLSSDTLTKEELQEIGDWYTSKNFPHNAPKTLKNMMVNNTIEYPKKIIIGDKRVDTDS